MYIETKSSIIDIITIFLLALEINLMTDNGIHLIEHIGFSWPLWIQILTLLATLSIRYSAQFKLHDVHLLSAGSMPYMLEQVAKAPRPYTMDEKYYNEFQYRFKVRGYKIMLFRLNRQVGYRTDAPHWLKVWVGIATRLHIWWHPAWAYREMDDEEWPIDVDSREEIDNIWGEG